jgi:hypothetical protein
MKRGAPVLLHGLQNAAEGSNIAVKSCKCLKQCKYGPTVRVASQQPAKGTVYRGATPLQPTIDFLVNTAAESMQGSMPTASQEGA